MAIGAAALAAGWGAAAGAQDLCADPMASCSADVSQDCLLRLGAGALSAGGAEAEACQAELDAYRACLALVSETCDSGPKAAEPSPGDFAIIDRAMAVRPKGDIGQVRAIGSQIRAGASFAGFDFSGIYLRGLDAADGDFSETKLYGADLRDAQAAGARFTAARFDFAALEDADFSGADASEARFYFTDAGGAVFRGASLARSNWFGADARGADFAGADLSHAAFVAMDLRDANFTGANLTGAVFQASSIEGAVFEGAAFSDTDVSSVTGDVAQFGALGPDALCARSSVNAVYEVELYASRKDPSATRGESYSELGEYRFPNGAGLEFVDRRCPAPEAVPAGREVIFRPETGGSLNSLASFSYSDGLIRILGRSAMDRRLTRWAEHMAAIRRDAAMVTYRGESYAALLERLDALVASALPLTMVSLDGEALLLYALRADPSLADTVNWRERALRSFQQGPRRADRGYTYLGRFFPEEVHHGQLNDDLIARYRAWTLRIAERMPDRLRFQLDTTTTKLERFVQGSGEARRISFLKALSRASAAGISGLTPTEVGVAGVRSYFQFRDRRSYVVPFEEEMEARARRRRRFQLGGEALIERVELKPTNTGHVLVFVVRLAEAQLLQSGAVIASGRFPN